jgi:hypothetical protein
VEFFKPSDWSVLTTWLWRHRAYPPSPGPEVTRRTGNGPPEPEMGRRNRKYTPRSRSIDKVGHTWWINSFRGVEYYWFLLFLIEEAHFISQYAHYNKWGLICLYRGKKCISILIIGQWQHPLILRSIIDFSYLEWGVLFVTTVRF